MPRATIEIKKDLRLPAVRPSPINSGVLSDRVFRPFRSDKEDEFFQAKLVLLAMLVAKGGYLVELDCLGNKENVLIVRYD